MNTVKYTLNRLNHLISVTNNYSRFISNLLDNGFIDISDEYDEKYRYGFIVLTIVNNKTKVILDNPFKNIDMGDVKNNIIPYHVSHKYENQFNITETVMDDICNFIDYVYHEELKEREKLLSFNEAN